MLAELKNIYLCFLYNPPENSSYTQSFENDLFELIENDITLFSGNGSVIIMGDMNARTGNESDLIENEFHNQNIPLFENYLPDSDIIDRFSRDHTILPRSRVLNDICIQTSLRILNGRCAGDLTGNIALWIMGWFLRVC